MNPLNGPLETGLRLIFVLEKAYPESLDVGDLVLLDHGLLHSADLGGPESLTPPTPDRSSELGVKRELVMEGLQVLLRSNLAEFEADGRGLVYRASESAHAFVDLLQSEYAGRLSERAGWIVEYLRAGDSGSVRSRMADVLGSWSEEFQLTEGGIS
jgi:hypothetical protein